LQKRSELETLHGPGFKLQVSIDIDANKPARISIRDNAAGIAQSEFPRAFRPAAVPPDLTGLSEFGMGMKSAACWFASRWHVRTKALGESVARIVRFDVAKIVNDQIEELEDYVARMAEALRQQESAQAWTKQDVNPSPATDTEDRRTGRTWWQRAEEYAAGHASEIHQSGEIGWRDGFTWWERTVQVLGTVRERAADWVSRCWKSFVDLVRNERDNRRDGNDMDR
jgi:Histidine kinase-, DNA gyrase B-, and HSP90-like ATPase